ncbi:hypothetical protein FRC04_012181 [Tulasnella sp. 424]|nr:hypothetical protein FRC04_012181 [Tulasnella sp. 424]
MMQERWKSDESQIPTLKAIYRINLPGQVYRRFDLALYGPGLYTYTNPALAYHATVSGDDLQPQGSNFALIQCRVVARSDSVPSPNSYAGFIDDSGVAFCAQPTAIIPTHVLICNAAAQPKASQHTISVNSNSVLLGSAPSTASPITSSIGQVDLSDTGETKSKPVKGNKGKAKAQAKALPQKSQGKGSGLTSSSKQPPGADLTEPAAANQDVLKSPQSGGSNAPQVVPAPKVMPGAFADAGSSAPPPPSSGESGAAGGQVPQAVYQSNLKSPGPGQFYAQTQGGFIPLPNPPPPGITLFILGADGNFYQAPISTATVAYPPIPVSVPRPAIAANQGLLPLLAPDPAKDSLRAAMAKLLEQQDRIDEDEDDDFDDLLDLPAGYRKPPSKRQPKSP